MTKQIAFCILIAGFLTGHTVLAQSYSDIIQLAKKEQLIRKTNFIPNSKSTQFNASNIDVIHYGAHWWINPANDSIRGKVAIAFRALEPMSSLKLDFASNLIVDQVKFRSGTADASFTGTYTLTIDLPQIISSGTTDSVVVFYHGRPAPSEMGSFSRFIHPTGSLIYTLSEPYGAKDWWPCKQSLVDKADSIDITIYTPNQYTAVSNGLLTRQSEQGGIRTFHWKHKYPIATYLIALAVSNYSHFRLKAVLHGDTLPIDNYCYSQSLAAWQTGMQDIVGIIQDFDTLLVPYPFRKEKYGHAEFAFGGGMEHQTLSFMEGPGFYLEAHELAHHWFGDMVTCASWHDIWLNEGFATYMGGDQVDRKGIRTWADQAKDLVAGITSVPDGSVYCPDTTNVGRIFDGRLSYGKGAALLRMLRWQLGDTAFWAGIRNYLNSPNHKYGFAKTADFQFFIEQSSGQNLTEFFNDWFYGQGHPNHHVEFNCCGPFGQLTVSQVPSHNSVSFFEIAKVPVVVKGFNQEEFSFNFALTGNNQIVPIPDVGFAIDTILIDPKHQIVARWTYSENIVSGLRLDKTATVQIFPVPATNFLEIQGMEESIYLEIFDVFGKPVWEGQHSSGQEISIKNLAPGMYSVKLRTSDRLILRRFLKEY